MKLFGFTFFESELTSAEPVETATEIPTINPATGLPMVAGEGSIDIAGNTYGTDSAHDSQLAFDDSFSGSGAGWDSGSSDLDGGCGGGMFD